MSGIKLISTGSALPRQEVTNFDLEKKVDTSDEWIATRTGIRSRHYCSGDESHLGLCMAAAQQAIQRAGVSPADIGVCLVATLTQDTMTPSAACGLQKELGLAEDTVCFDLNAACAGFVYGLHTAECLLAASPRRYGLVIGCEVLSRITDFTDRSTCVLFGDGAGAVVVEWGADYPSICAVMGSRGNREVLYIPGVNTGSASYIHMDGKEVFRFAIEVLPRCTHEVAEKAGVPLEAIDRFVFHQANQRILDHAVKKLKLDPARCAGNIARTGNTSAASVPILLDELVTTGQLKSGQKALCAGFGGGLTWAGCLLQLA